MQLLLHAGAQCTVAQEPGRPLWDCCAQLVDALLRCATVTACAQLQEGERSATVEVSSSHYVYPPLLCSTSSAAVV
jgi:hypothetical protein